MSWSPSSWRDFPIKQQPAYQDMELLKKVEAELSSYPPL
ncbi:MAG: 3-deoxy-7-phosphoheptulonate synthase, partial [Campylobacterota bacterium]|nr:3-deoxy-7-phosphoheptulonate synthase [Campylobacterota bacterium]